MGISGMTKYKKQWDVPSSSDDSKTYKVSLCEDGKLICHCWKFLRNRNEPCKHIIAVMNGELDQVSEPMIVLAMVKEVHINPKNRNQVFFPLIPIGDVHFLLTVVYDGMRCGVSWKTLRERYHLPARLSKATVVGYVEQYGRRIYKESNTGDRHFDYEIVRVDNPVGW